LAGAVGFVLGSRAGRGPYEQIERWGRKVAKRPEVRQVTDQVAASASQVSNTAAHTVSSIADHAAGVVAQATHSASDTLTHNIDKAGKQASDIIDESTEHLGN
jgi:hypothetical protein